MKTKIIWISCAISFVILAIHEETSLNLSDDLVSALQIFFAITFFSGLGIEMWNSLIEWKDEKGGIGGAATDLTEKTISIAGFLLILGIGAFIITSLFANPMATIIWLFVGIVAYAYLSS